MALLSVLRDHYDKTAWFLTYEANKLQKEPTKQLSFKQNPHSGILHSVDW